MNKGKRTNSDVLSEQETVGGNFLFEAPIDNLQNDKGNKPSSDAFTWESVACG
jgi:hypothetical protein